MEIVYVDFKGRGIKAAMNKEDFNPAIHKLWSDKPAKLVETHQEAAAVRPPVTRNAPK